jgi:hypothetical protein
VAKYLAYAPMSLRRKRKMVRLLLLRLTSLIPLLVVRLL